MNRYDTRDKSPRVYNVQKVETSTDHTKRRVIFAALFFLVAVIALGAGINSLVNKNNGWDEIKANKTETTNISEDFVFQYNLGAGKEAAASESKVLVSYYTDWMLECYKVFTNDEKYDDVNNLYYLNHHPNEEIEIDPLLYSSIKKVEDYCNRLIYLGAIYNIYDDIFMVTDEGQAKEYDPYYNEELAEEFKTIADYANNSEHVNIELLGNNKVILHVSEDYMAFAKDENIDTFVDFSYMRNAFVIDYMADELEKLGYTNAIISSYDGYSRNLVKESDEEFIDTFYGRLEDGSVGALGQSTYRGNRNMVKYRNFIVGDRDAYRYFYYEDGTVRSLYLSGEDGKCKMSRSSIQFYSDTLPCADILLSTINLYVQDSVDNKDIDNMLDKGIYSIYTDKGEVRYNDDLDFELIEE